MGPEKQTNNTGCHILILPGNLQMFVFVDFHTLCFATASPASNSAET
jgi:hypothetical protein